MRIYLKINPDKFHPDQIWNWNDGALCFSEDVAPTRRRSTRTRWV